MSGSTWCLPWYNYLHPHPQKPLSPQRWRGFGLKGGGVTCIRPQTSPKEFWDTWETTGTCDQQRGTDNGRETKQTHIIGFLWPHSPHTQNFSILGENSPQPAQMPHGMQGSHFAAEYSPSISCLGDELRNHQGS